MGLEDEQPAFLPDWASPPGDTIEEMVELGDLFDGTAELAKRSGLSFPQEIDDLLCGKSHRDFCTLRPMHHVGGTSTFWLNRDANYVRDCERLGITPGEKKAVDHCPAPAEPIAAKPPESKYETRVVSVVVLPRGEPLYSEQATTISIADEASGEFLRISQEGGHIDEAKCVLIEPEEWSVLRAAIDMMVANCRKEE